MMVTKPQFEKEPIYTAFECNSLSRTQWFIQNENAFFLLQSTKPRTLGFAMHDSPIGMLSWMADKLYVWSDSYPWTPTELITWTLLHYFPGPTTAFTMSKENNVEEQIRTQNYIAVATGVSAFPKELGLVPRSWAETSANVVFWQEHSSGGHFAAHENPKDFAGDLIRFYRQVWKA